MNVLDDGKYMCMRNYIVYISAGMHVSIDQWNHTLGASVGNNYYSIGSRGHWNVAPHICSRYKIVHKYSGSAVLFGE